jgi:hypothetical protein
MEESFSAASEINYKRFKMLVDEIFFVDLKTISEIFNISTRSVLRFTERLDDEIDQKRLKKNKENNFRRPYFSGPGETAEHKKNGTYRYIQRNFSPSLIYTRDDEKLLLRFLEGEITWPLTLNEKMITLFTNHSARLHLYNKNLSVIEECMRLKREMHVQIIYMQDSSVLKDTIISPAYLDINRGVLYATRKNKVGLFRLDILALVGCTVTDKPTDNYFETNQCKADLKHVDIFGAFKKDSKPFKVHLQMSGYARAKFLSVNRHFIRYIKPVKKKRDDEELSFPFQLRIELFELLPVSQLVFSYHKHIKIIGDTSFKKRLKDDLKNFTAFLTQSP